MGARKVESDVGGTQEDLVFWSRFHEFFEIEPHGMLAIRNLTIFVGLVVGSFVVLLMAILQTLTAEEFGVYMFSCGGVYSFGKWQDERSTRFRMDTESDRPAPVTNNTINQPAVANVGGDTKVTS